SFVDTTARVSVERMLDSATISFGTRPPGMASLDGIVRESSGRPVRGARIILTSGGGAATSRNDGRFSLQSLPAGSQSFDIRAIGFSPARRLVDLRSDTSTAV